MRHSNIYRLDLWEVVLILLSIGLLIISYYCKDNYVITTLVGTATCILTAILILYFQRIHRKLGLLSYYSPIAGKYVRLDIGQDNTGGLENTDIREKNVGLEINITYLEESKFRATIQYWKNENAEALSSFEFDEKNTMIAAGTYKYIKGQSFIGHFGSLTLFLLENEPNRIYVRYHHVFPRQTEYNPDNNRGWEIWEKKNSS